MGKQSRTVYETRSGRVPNRQGEEEIGTGPLIGTQCIAGAARAESQREVLLRGAEEEREGKESLMIWDTAARRAGVQRAQTPKSTYLRYRERKYGHRLRINRKRSQSIALLLEEHALQVGQERTIMSANIG